MFLTVLDGPLTGRTYSLDRPVVVGRDADCDIVLDADERVSRRHATLTATGSGSVRIDDLGSTNGVHVAGGRIDRSTTVSNGGVATIGRTRISITAAQQASGPATVIGGPGAPGSNNVADATAAGAHARTGHGSTPAGAVTGPPVVGLGSAAPAPPAAGVPVTPTPARSGKGKRTLAWVAGLAVLGVGSVVAAVSLNGAGEDAPTGELTAAQITERSSDGVLQVQAEIDGQLMGTGTGWVYDLDSGLIVTNYHVVGVGTEFSVGTGPARRPAQLVGAAPCDDLAVLRVDRTSDLVELEIGEQAELSNGDDVVALGYPATASQTPALVTSTGTVSSPRTSFDAPALDLPRYPNVVLTQTPINPGDSGGPLLDTEGRVVGVNSAGSNVTQNQNYAIGADRLRELLPQLAAGDSIGWNGFVFRFPGSPDEVAALGYDPLLFGQAVFALDAVPQSPAANTGIFRDLDGLPVPIVAVDGVPMDGTLQTLCSQIGDLQRGDTSSFTVTDGFDLFDVRFDFA
ncbi:MAG: trypsin-like peptidase domain-containing protein [Actinomycetota bacterium]